MSLILDLVWVQCGASYREGAIVEVVGEATHPGPYSIREGVDGVRSILERAGGFTEFADLMQVTKSAASQLVTFLEARGLVERVPDPSDGRATLVRATPAAAAGFRAARHRYAEIEDEWELAIGREGLDELANMLGRLENARPSAHPRRPVARRS